MWFTSGCCFCVDVPTPLFKQLWVERSSGGHVKDKMNILHTCPVVVQCEAIEDEMRVIGDVLISSEGGGVNKKHRINYHSLGNPAKWKRSGENWWHS